MADATFRLIETLGSVDTILAEDTRVTSKLLARYEIQAHLERCDENVIAVRTPELVERIIGGENIAFVSDAGTPCVSDPGVVLVDAALDAGLHVEVIPGPAAATSALSVSGLPCHTFYFGGFLPRKAGAKRKALEALRQLDATLIFYESPHRTLETFEAISDALGNRRVVLARELTKMHEEILRLPVQDMIAALHERELKGEVVILVAPASDNCDATENEIDPEEVAEFIAAQKANGARSKEIARQLSEQFGIPKNEAYELVIGA